ncbi:malate synthase [Lutibacter oricola]|uniref:Malate synthase n=1 Tax=Lutibacter oricola TaxID=762486 RepID=A0A1H3C691_9FLAO|nr:malate synthase A [Lutibacter oricola]SDX49692.1 malate synthase [Lutibacter oricola]
MENFNETTIQKISFAKDVKNYYNEILTNEALDFLVQLHEKFNSERLALLKQRVIQQEYFDKGNFPTFPEETESVREGDWTAAPLPKDLLDRRVEITGPVDRKMVINALNSGAKVFMADLEDSNSPSWDNCLEGQKNLKDAVRKTISFTNATGKKYILNEEIATLLVRPRGLHLAEKNLMVDGQEMSASLVDFGLYFFHNAKKLVKMKTGPYFYLPKLEHYKEARWWNEVFIFAQEYMNIDQCTIKATVLIETITASFQIDEIIYELRNHMAGLNCGRWDYIFSYIKKFRNHSGFMVPNRDQVTMASPFMEAYSLRVIQRCHKRNVHAIGGMAAQIPVKNNEESNNIAFEKVRVDKEREAKNGHDGTWVAHPGLVPIAMEIFDKYMPNANQIDVKRNDLHITEEQLVEQPQGTITESGIRKNINVGILYIESWLSGNGAAALYNLMEDAATAEISRTQLWQWLHNEITLEDGRKFTTELYVEFLESEIQIIRNLIGNERYENGKFKLTIQLFDALVLSEKFEEFLTLEAYKYI